MKSTRPFLAISSCSSKSLFLYSPIIRKISHYYM